MTQGPHPDELVERAREQTGLEDLGSPHFREMLDLWVADATRPAISEVGRAMMLRLAEHNLGLRLRLTRTLSDHPEITEVRIPPIVFISGFARSGTTLLHTLLGLHPQARTLRKWELLAPLPPPEQATWSEDPRIARVQASVDKLRGSGLEQMHWVEATDAEECTHGYYDCSGLIGRGAAAAAPAWWSRLSRRDELPTLLELRRLIQLLLWHNPPPDDSVLVLKNPTTAAHLADFAQVFPEATVLLCHRDPYRCAASTSQIVDLVSRQFYAPGVDRHTAFPDFERVLLDSFATTARRMRQFAEAHPTWRQVRYADLMADPVGASARALEAVGLPAPTTWGPTVQGFLDWQRSGGRASPPPSYEVAFTRREVDEQFELARYKEAFVVPDELSRVTDPAR